MPAYQLRPMSTGEILDGAFVLLRRQFLLLMGIAVVCQGIPTAMDVYIELTGGPAQNEGLSLLDRVLTMVGGVFVTGATVRVVSEAYLGGTPQFGDALRFAGHKFGTVFGANFISGFFTILGTLLLIIPGIVIACGCSVSAAAAALESGSSSEAVRRSWQLTKGFKWKALGLGIVSIGLILVVYLGAGFVIGFLAEVFGGLDALTAVAIGAISLLIYPVLSCVFTLFYYDLRVRKEGFDLEMLSQQLGVVDGVRGPATIA